MEQAKPLTENKELSLQSNDVLSESLMLKIKDNEYYGLAANMLLDIKTLLKKVKAHYAPSIKKAYETHKEIKAAEKKQTKPLLKAEGILKGKMEDFHAEQECIKRLEEERIRKELQEKREAELLEEAEETGDEEILEKEIFVPKINIESVPKQERISYVDVWDFEIVDFKMIPEHYKLIDSGKIRKIVKALKSE